MQSKVFNLNLIPIGVAVVAVFLAGVTANRALPEYQRQPDQTGLPDVYEHKPATSLVGEFRGTLAGFLYARADEYMHGGVIMRPSTQKDEDMGRRMASHGDNMRNTHGSGETSVIPEPDKDYRGFWGQLERDTKPFMDIRHHRHRDLKEALPLFRLMTWADPHFIEGYNFGAFIAFSATDGKQMRRVVEFLEEGIKNNPNSYILHTECGQYYLNNLNDINTAAMHFQKAVDLLANQTPQQLERLNQRDDMQAEHAYEFLVLCYRKLGDSDKEIAAARQGLAKFPYSATCRRSFQRHGLPVPQSALPHAP